MRFLFLGRHVSRALFARLTTGHDMLNWAVSVALAGTSISRVTISVRHRFGSFCKLKVIKCATCWYPELMYRGCRTSWVLHALRRKGTTGRGCGSVNVAASITPASKRRKREWINSRSRVLSGPGMELKEGFVCVKKRCCCKALAVLKSSLCFTCNHKQEEHVPSQKQNLIERC